jgi:TolB-like protein
LLYQFEDCSIDVARRAVEPKVLDFLLYLLANRDRLVSKDELVAAIWDGRIVSDSAISACIHAARLALGDKGAGQRLIKTFPRKGIRFVGSVIETQPASSVRDSAPKTQTLALPDRPSLAVLPFTSMNDPDQAYFADGMVDEIILALSRLRSLFVIARNSSFVYKDRSIDVRQVGRELGVRYVIEGSVRKSANRLRLVAQLIDAESRATLAAHRCEGVIGDIFDLQDKITAEIVAVIAPKLEATEINRARRKPTGSLDAYDHYLRGLECFYQWNQGAMQKALTFFVQATALDEGFASAYGMAARCYTARRANGWVVDRELEVFEARRLSRKAAAFGADDAVALASAGFTIANLLREIEPGRVLVEQALNLNPNLAAAWYYAGWIEVWRDNAAGALERFANAIRHSPIDPLMFNFYTGMASAHFVAGNLDKARTHACKALEQRPDYAVALRVAAASCSLTGRVEEGRKYAAAVQKLDPDFRLQNAADRVTYSPLSLIRFVEGLRLAGAPE